MSIIGLLVIVFFVVGIFGPVIAGVYLALRLNGRNRQPPSVGGVP